MSQNQTFVNIEDITPNMSQTVSRSELDRLRRTGVLDIYKTQRIYQNVIMFIVFILLTIGIVFYFLIRQNIVGDNLLPNSAFDHSKKQEKDNTNANVVDTLAIILYFIGIFIAFGSTYFFSKRIYRIRPISH